MVSPGVLEFSRDSIGFDKDILRRSNSAAPAPCHELLAIEACAIAAVERCAMLTREEALALGSIDGSAKPDLKRMREQ